MNKIKTNKISILIDIINGSLLITSLILISIFLRTIVSSTISIWLTILLFSSIYLAGIYVSRRSFIGKNTPFKIRAMTNILLILIATSLQFGIVNYTGYWFAANFSHLAVINTVLILVLGLILQLSYKLYTKSYD